MSAPTERAVAVRCLALDHAATSTCLALRERGVDAVLLKGAGLAYRLGVDRRYGDVDLLVAPAAFSAAERILAELGAFPVISGARLDDLSPHERSWRLPGHVPLVVDLHRGFAGAADAEALWHEVWNSAEEFPLAGGRIPIPGQNCTALFVALHAAAPGRSVRPRADLERALMVLPADAWRAAGRIARRCQAEEAYALGLRLADRGATMAAELGLPERSSPSRWLLAHHGSVPAYSLARLAELPTVAARLRHICRRAVPSPAMMRHSSPLARRGRLGLLLAYANRLGRHAARLPRAVLELRAARRAVR
ncbi:hypothetical protein GCM10011608_42700 [Micromonospora sonchi]|uniref:Nucleotidyltransferase family protein n=1 Tax=Micromonospora sonchi TaxID=1763543 RepID=A0A917U353_9ACTN|nr:nucleotidyltransferase family protein [Micromonospora sonchi]GGM53281.1 hypothetical protein GCM10011608_42700 [Micromonospora sonchi]